MKREQHGNCHRRRGLFRGLGLVLLFLFLFFFPAAPLQAANLLDPATGGTLTLVSSTNGGNSGAQSHDGNTATFWESSPGVTGNDLIFRFDPAYAAACFNQLQLYSNGADSRNLRHFLLLSTADETLAANTGFAGWQRLPASAAAAGSLNVLQRALGGTLLSTTPVQDSSALNLNDGNPLSGWRSGKSDIPVTFEYGFDTDFDGLTGNPVNLTAVRIYNPNSKEAVNTFRLYVRLQGSAVWTLHGTFNALQDTAPQTWNVTPVNNVVGVRLQVVTNHGHNNFTSAEEFELIGTSAAANYVFSASNTGGWQTFAFPTTLGKLFRLRTLSNYGGTTTAITELRLDSATGPGCPGGCSLAGFQIAAPASALACPDTRAAVTITALCTDGSTHAGYTGTVNLATLPAGGLFYTAASGGAPIASITFTTAEAGAKTVYLDFLNEFSNVRVVAADSGGAVSSTAATGIDFRAFGFRISPLANQSSCAESGSFTITAYGKLESTPGCSQLSGFAGNKQVKGWFSYLDPAANPANTRLSLTTGGVPTLLPTSQPAAANLTIPFVAGQAGFTLSYRDAGQLRLHLRHDLSPYNSDPHAPMLADSAPFTVIPAGFRLAATKTDTTALNNTTSAGLPVEKAGDPFRLTLQAVCADQTVTPNYQPSSAQLWVERSGPTAGGDEGTLAIKGTPFATSLAAAPSWNPLSGLFSNGQIADPGLATATASYSEVGLIALHVRDPNYQGSVIAETVLPVGRFIPHHLEAALTVDTPALANSCLAGSFSSLGNTFPFNTALFAPRLTVSGRNAAGAVTRNYEGAYWKLAGPLALAYSDNSGSGLVLSPSGESLALPDTTDCNGSVDLSPAAAFSYARPAMATPAAPFAAAIDASMPAAGAGGLTDADGVCFDTGSGCQAFSRAGLGGATLRHGRLRVLDGFGPETEDITGLPFVAQYWDGTAWVTNTGDTCTATPTFCPPARVASVQPLPLVAGAGSMTITTAGDPTEILDVCPTSPAWLTELADCSAPDETCGTVTFGIYRGNDRIINWKEIVR